MIKRLIRKIKVINKTLCFQKKISAYKNIHRGRRAFIIGNGPSVSILDLEKLKNEITFCCNKFYMAYPNMEFRPSYTLSVDRQMVDEFGNDIINNCESQVFIGNAEYPELSGDFIWVKLRRYNSFKFKGGYPYNIDDGGSVIIAGLQIAFYMGIREIYLYGVDHSFRMEELDDKGMAHEDGNHFISGYREGKAWFPPELKRIENAFELSRKYYENADGCIINATRGGRLEIFKREDISRILR
jgi:hypothetical protein